MTVNRQGQVVRRETHTARQFTLDLGDGIGLEMVAIPGAKFLMGSPSGSGYPDEHPQHAVTIASFFMARHSTTQAQWQAMMGTELPCRFKGANHPLENVSWDEASAFCQRLSEMSGNVYRLPSEAQWEYACRAETTTPFYCGETITTDLANYVGEHTYLEEPRGLYRHTTTEVGSFPPNPFGLYDMHGNV